MKKTSIPRKPTAAKAPARSADEWVTGGRAAEPAPEPAAEPKPEKPQLVRYTIDIPKALHSKIKIKCAERGVKMNEEITKLLQNHFGD